MVLFASDPPEVFSEKYVKHHVRNGHTLRIISARFMSTSNFYHAPHLRFFLFTMTKESSTVQARSFRLCDGWNGWLSILIEPERLRMRQSNHAETASSDRCSDTRKQVVQLGRLARACTTRLKRYPAIWEWGVWVTWSNETHDRQMNRHIHFGVRRGWDLNPAKKGTSKNQ